MIHRSVLRDLESHAAQHDKAAVVLESGGSPVTAELAQRAREIAASYRHLLALAEIEDQLLSGAADTLAEELLAGEGQ